MRLPINQPEVVYAHTEQELNNLVARLYKSSEQGQTVGFDTEFSGVELGKRSACCRAKLHLASFAIPRTPLQLSPRGYYLSDAWVVDSGGILATKPWLESEAPKAVHNLGVDVFSCNSVGVTLRGGVNTLALARWAWPGRARGGEGGFTLDALGRDLLGEGKTESYADIFSYETEELVVSFRTLKSGLKKEVTRNVKTMQWVPLDSVGPGHPLWLRVLAYAARDAVLALGVNDLATAEIKRRKVWMPW